MVYLNTENPTLHELFEAFAIIFDTSEIEELLDCNDSQLTWIRLLQHRGSIYWLRATPLRFWDLIHGALNVVQRTMTGGQIRVACK